MEHKSFIVVLIQLLQNLIQRVYIYCFYEPGLSGGMKGIGGKGGKDGAIFSPEFKLIIRTKLKI